MRAVMFLILMCFLLIKSAHSASMESYCFTPPFISQAVAPNILLVIDASGSMTRCAYNPRSNGRGCCYRSSGCGWTYTGTEEGYFIPDKVYRYNWSGGYWEETNATPSSCPNRRQDIRLNRAYRGSCLNFLYMTRIDLVRWALTGGTLSSCSTGVNVYNPSFNRCNPEAYGMPGDQTSCDDTGCILEGYRGIRVKVPWERIHSSLLFQLKNLSLKPRVGVMFFSGRSVRHDALVYIGDFKGSNDYDALNPYKNVITQINVEDPDGATPTAPALWDAYNYFAQEDPQYNGFIPQQGSGDRWRNPMYQCIDKNENGQCESNEFELVPCAKNFVILLTDGQWNRGGNPVGSSCSIYDGYEDHSADPVVPAYWLHKRGFTNRITGIDSYVEAVYGIGLWLRGTGELAVKNVAMYGSFDRSKTWPDGLSGYPTDTCSMDDCGYGRGSGCTDLPPSSPDWDKDGDGVPDTFYNASNAAEIKNAILSAILDILRRASSGATVATLASRSQVSSLIVQPYFYPSYVRDDGAQISWLGFLRSFWVDANQDLREDTVESKILNISGTSIDRVFQFFYDTADASTKAVILDEDYPNVCSADSTKSIQELIPVFNSGCTLANTDPHNRNVYFNKDGALKKLTPSEATYFRNIWKVCSNDSTKLCSSNADCGAGGVCQAISSSEASCVIEYLLGNDNPSGCGSFDSVKRTRTLDVTNFCGSVGITGEKTWKLGDIVYSTPVGAGNRKLRIYDSRYGDITYYQYWTSTEYQSRFGIVAVSANDGMLHIFRMGHLKETFNPAKPIELVNAPGSSSSTKVGVEEFAFMPKNAIPYLYWYGHNNYCRVPTVDYRINILDVSANLQGCVKKGDKCWSTILIGVMGFGGKKITTDQTYASSVFVLDLTKWLNGGSINDIKLLWETKLPDNTLTLSFPAVIRTGDPNENGSWYVVIGSGPTQLKNSVDEEDYPTNPKIYFIPIKNGLTAGDIVEVSIDLPPDTKAAVGDIYPIDFDNDYRDDSLYFGMYGKHKVGGDWYSWGGFFRLRLRDVSDTSLTDTNGYKAITSLTSSDISAVVDLGDYATDNHIPPVFGAPTFSRDDKGQLWVYFGTGKFLSLDDRTPPYTNYLFGIKDPCWDGHCQTTYNCDLISGCDIDNLTQADMLSDEVVVTEKKEICTCDNGVCENKEVIVATRATPPSPTTKKGWSVQLSDYEAAYSQPAVFGSIVYFNTYKSPGSDVCALEGTSNLYALHYTSGKPYAPRPPLLRPDMVEDAGGGRVQVRGFVNLGPGIPAGGQPIQITEKAIYLQTSTGKIERIPYQATGRRGIILWIEK